MRYCDHRGRRFYRPQSLGSLGRIGLYDVLGITLDSSRDDLLAALTGAGFVFHLAGVNRPKDVASLRPATLDSRRSCARRWLKLAAGRRWCSPRHPGGARQSLWRKQAGGRGCPACSMARAVAQPVLSLSPDQCFWQMGKPNYNSAVATFCHNIARGLDSRSMTRRPLYAWCMWMM
jgi:UDP-2-acetamido-2,6-beta-L-arabino-hexul-4-ose reductase